jgi:hypothetical protein
VESPVADVPARSGPQLRVLASLQVAAAGAATGLAVTSSGSIVLIVLLLIAASVDPAVGVVGVAAVMVQLARLGSTSMPAASGAQAVLAPAVLTGPPVAALATPCLLVAFVIVAPRRWMTVPLALTGVALAMGPAVVGPVSGLVRLMATILVVGVAWLTFDRFRTDGRPAVTLAAMALVLAVLSRPHGALRWSGLLATGPVVIVVIAGAAGAAAALAAGRLRSIT